MRGKCLSQIGRGEMSYSRLLPSVMDNCCLGVDQVEKLMPLNACIISPVDQVCSENLTFQCPFSQSVHFLFTLADTSYVFCSDIAVLALLSSSSP